MASWKARVRGGIPGPAGSLMPMVVLVVVAVLAGGCSSGSSPGDGQTAATPTPTPAASAVCADVVALQSSLNALRQIEVTKVGSNGLKAAVQDVGAKAQALERSAGSQLGPERAQFQAAVSALGSTLSGVTDSSSLTAALPAIRQDLTQVGNTGQALVASAKSTFACP